MTHSRKTPRRLGAWVALVAACLLMPACRREEPPKEPPADPTAPESYMNDAAFLKRVGAERAAQRDLIRERNVIVEQMKKMVDDKKAELKTDDPAKVKAALEADPAWTNLLSQCEAANRKVEANRAKIYGEVRKRLTPTNAPATKKISK